MSGTPDDENGPAADVRFARSSGVIWRLGPDRIVAQQVRDRSANPVCDLTGRAALIWLALDQSATRCELNARLAEAEVAAEVSDADLGLLLDAGWITIEPAHNR